MFSSESQIEINLSQDMVSDKLRHFALQWYENMWRSRDGQVVIRSGLWAHTSTHAYRNTILGVLRVFDDELGSGLLFGVVEGSETTDHFDVALICIDGWHLQHFNDYSVDSLATVAHNKQTTSGDAYRSRYHMSGQWRPNGCQNKVVTTLVSTVIRVISWLNGRHTSAPFDNTHNNCTQTAIHAFNRRALTVSRSLWVCESCE